MSKQMGSSKGGKAPVIKSKFGKALGYRTPDHFKGKTFGAKSQSGTFDPARFKTQHKG